jgi:hypothetical protein
LGDTPEFEAEGGSTLVLSRQQRDGLGGRVQCWAPLDPRPAEEVLPAALRQILVAEDILGATLVHPAGFHAAVAELNWLLDELEALPAEEADRLLASQTDPEHQTANR